MGENRKMISKREAQDYNALKVERGVWTGAIDQEKIFNHDEIPQFLDYAGHTSLLPACSRDLNIDFKEGEYVKIVSGAFTGYYGVISDEKVADKYVIQYFEKKTNWWVSKDNDFDSR